MRCNVSYLTLFLNTFLFLLTFAVNAQQEIEVKGFVKDSLTEKPLSSSTIYLETIADTTMVSYSISDRRGFFSISEFTKDSILRLNISYTGMTPYRKEIKVKNSPIDLDTVYLKSTIDQLDELVLKAKRSPVVVKKDTLEFNASSFKTLDGANLEELLDKLPGLEVDKNGNITVNGKPVERILVNGRSFFGDDPKIALKNLPKSIIDKIQVVDTKTKEQEFTGEDGDDQNKTINVKIDEDKNKGFFSRATLSGGTDDRYAMSGIANYFKEDTRISVIAGSNNINSPGFSFDEVFDMMRGSIRRISRGANGSFGLNGINFGSSNGITKSETAGLSYVDSFSDNQELESNYFFGASKTKNKVTTQRENILPDGSFFSNAEERSVNRSNSHRANLFYSIEIDSLTKIYFRPGFDHSTGDRQNSRNSSSTNADGELVNQLSSENKSDFDNISLNNDLTLTRRFKKKGAYFRLRLGNENSDNKNISFFNSTRQIFGDNPDITTQDQKIVDRSQSNSYTISGRYRNLIIKDLYYSVNYNFETQNKDSKRNVFDLDETTDRYSDLNEALSNTFTTRSQKHIPQAGLRYDDDTLTVEGRLGLNNTNLKTDDQIQDVSFTSDFSILSYYSRLSYRFKGGERLSLRLRNSSNIPSINQLQPVRIQTDPLNIIEGNPDLNATIRHRINLNLYDFNRDSGNSYSIYMNYGYTEDQVVSVVNTDEDLIRTRSYTNLSGNQNFSFYGRYNIDLKNSKNQNDKESIKLKTKFNARYNKNLGFSNDQKFRRENYVISPNIGLSYEIDDLLSFEPNFDVSYNLTQYDLNQNQEQEFTNYNFALEAITYWPDNVVFGNDITFTRFGNVNPDFENTSWLWNVSLGYTFADEKAIVKIKAYDLLDQNINTRRRTGDDFIVDTQQLILQRYFMLSFTYKFKKFGGKDPNNNKMNFF